MRRPTRLLRSTYYSLPTNMLVHRWPRAIIHLDGDAFFASVEQAVKPELKGRPVVTGQERNIVAAASYEAKALGIKRGVTLWDAKKMCPELVILPTDYETVSLFSKRMFDIARRYTPTVEEYGIDEGFLDITGLRRVHRCSYENIARRLQEDIHRQLDITVSVGLSVSKVLAKIGSKAKKPAGLVVIDARSIAQALQNLPVEDVWNIGPNTAALLKNHGWHTAGQFASASIDRLQNILSKPGLEIWQELNGQSVLEITTAEKASYQSIGKSKTFTPPSTNPDYVFAQLVKNLENACLKARRYHQAAGQLTIFLKRQDHRSFGLEAKLERVSAYPNEMVGSTRQLFEQLFIANTPYRATGVILSHLTAATLLQPTLFERPIKIMATRHLYAAIDELRYKYGKHTVHQAISLPAQKTAHLSARGHLPVRKKTLLPGETNRQRLPLPLVVINLG